MSNQPKKDAYSRPKLRKFRDLQEVLEYFADKISPEELETLTRHYKQEFEQSRRVARG